MSTAPLRPARQSRDRLRGTVPRRSPFLQGLISNDIERVTEARGIYAGAADATGQVPPRLLRAAAGGMAVCWTARGPRVGDLGGPAGGPTGCVPTSNSRTRPRIFGWWRCFGAESADGAFDLPPGEGGAAPCEGRHYHARPQERSARASRSPAPRRGPCVSWSRAGFARGHVADYERHRIAHGAPDGQPRHGGRPGDADGVRLRGAQRRRLREGLLRRPGADGAHQASRPGAPAARTGCAGRAAAAQRHADHGGRAGGGRDPLRAWTLPRWRCCVWRGSRRLPRRENRSPQAKRGLSPPDLP